MNDQAIIDLYFARNERAIAETAKSYGNVCMQVSMNILQSRPDAEECVNDTYLKTWNAIPPTKPHSLCAFVCRITRNLSLNRLRDLRRERRDRDMTLPLDELENCIPSRALEEEADARALGRAIDHFLGTLPKETRVIFLRRYWFGDSVRDIAAGLGLRENTVTVRLSRTREKLRIHLQKEGYLDE